MKDKELIFGVCCEYCNKFEKDECPVKLASPWSRWDYCNHFRDKESGKSIPEMLMENV